MGQGQGDRDLFYVRSKAMGQQFTRTIMVFIFWSVFSNFHRYSKLSSWHLLRLDVSTGVLILNFMLHSVAVFFADGLGRVHSQILTLGAKPLYQAVAGMQVDWSLLFGWLGMLIHR
ncbi:hypothetical protein BDP27DRAFT_1330723 [Rhodocollybia butyracea]|uniref:Uncharacterized protein n=1 Tax=Rhodocollybia butyracea TaxID=206335 RepID=A0A9P5PNK9_9AGAR|nr:hypothetical protein BDP27DRAFT_1330723 [Rhodocollybia butyracea]